jgi:hypothetical protein
LEKDLDELGPVIARRLRRARRLAQTGTVAAIALIVRRHLPSRKREHR